jgi:hypothetical protein
MDMRRLMTLALFVVLAASVPLAAQHGGGHGSGGGHGGFSGHSGFSGGGGHAAGGHSFSGARSGAGFAPRSYSSGRSFRSANSRGFGSRNFNHQRNSGVGLRLRTYGYRNNCYGYGCGWGSGYGYPYLGGGVDPYWWWDSSSSDEDQQNQMGLANEMNAQGLDEQRMRQQGDQGSYPRSAPPAPHQPERSEAVLPTVLVFHDQHKEEVNNYAIIGLTLWVLDPQHKQRVPLSDLDLAATAQANDDRGVEFRLPGAGAGQ